MKKLILITFASLSIASCKRCYRCTTTVTTYTQHSPTTTDVYIDDVCGKKLMKMKKLSRGTTRSGSKADGTWVEVNTIVGCLQHKNL